MSQCVFTCRCDTSILWCVMYNHTIYIIVFDDLVWNSWKIYKFLVFFLLRILLKTNQQNHHGPTSCCLSPPPMGPPWLQVYLGSLVALPTWPPPVSQRVTTEMGGVEGGWSWAMDTAAMNFWYFLCYGCTSRSAAEKQIEFIDVHGFLINRYYCYTYINRWIKKMMTADRTCIRSV